MEKMTDGLLLALYVVGMAVLWMIFLAVVLVFPMALLHLTPLVPGMCVVVYWVWIMVLIACASYVFDF